MTEDFDKIVVGFAGGIPGPEVCRYTQAGKILWNIRNGLAREQTGFPFVG